ncbi:MAG: FMN-binding protein [Clostridia bacterium]|nr:FMN-binding protein [Clostridia bacterium]
MLPSWAYRLNQNLDWWISATGDLINSQGKRLIGAKADGSYILEGEEIPDGAYVEDQNAAFLATIELADNQKAAYAKGNNGMVFVRVTLDGETITNVEIIAQNETAGVADGALEQIPAAIVAANSADVDIVSGATYTSNAIIDAVKAAIAE